MSVGNDKLYTYTRKAVMNYTLLALATIKKAKTKVVPILNRASCKRCGSLATLSMVNNEIKISRCACKKGN